jgi:hypothetical protein
MEVLGDINGLKEEIERIYENRFNEFSEEQNKMFEQEKKEINEEHEKEKRKLETEIDNEKRKVFRTVLSKEKINAKREFEMKREELIGRVFDITNERIKDVLLGDDYIGSLKRFIEGKERMKIAANYEEYNNHFPNMSINNRQRGIVFTKKNQIFDFSYDSFLESRKLDLRQKISNILFENVS